MERQKEIIKENGHKSLKDYDHPFMMQGRKEREKEMKKKEKTKKKRVNKKKTKRKQIKDFDHPFDAWQKRKR